MALPRSSISGVPVAALSEVSTEGNSLESWAASFCTHSGPGSGSASALPAPVVPVLTPQRLATAAAATKSVPLRDEPCGEMTGATMLPNVRCSTSRSPVRCTRNVTD